MSWRSRSRFSGVLLGPRSGAARALRSRRPSHGTSQLLLGQHAGRRTFPQTSCRCGAMRHPWQRRVRSSTRPCRCHAVVVYPWRPAKDRLPGVTTRGFPVTPAEFNRHSGYLKVRHREIAVAQVQLDRRRVFAPAALELSSIAWFTLIAVTILDQSHRAECEQKRGGIDEEHFGAGARRRELGVTAETVNHLGGPGV